MSEMDWIDELDDEFYSPESHSKVEGHEELARGCINICLNIFVRFIMNTNADMKMSPTQWDVAVYKGDKKWEILSDFDFSSLGEVILIDKRPYGSGVMGEFFVEKGFEHFRIGFLIPERVGSKKQFAFYVARERKTSKLGPSEIWGALRPGIEKWYESILRDDISVLLQYCEKQYERAPSPQIPDNL